MEEHLIELGHDINTFPIIVQFNKRDLPHVVPVAELRRQLDVQKRACFEASALRGNGVFDTLKAAMNTVVVQVRRTI
jgi:signal recognition particle receptor subunit beta